MMDRLLARVSRVLLKLDNPGSVNHDVLVGRETLVDTRRTFTT